MGSKIVEPREAESRTVVARAFRDGGYEEVLLMGARLYLGKINKSWRSDGQHGDDTHQYCIINLSFTEILFSSTYPPKNGYCVR